VSHLHLVPLDDDEPTEPSTTPVSAERVALAARAEYLGESLRQWVTAMLDVAAAVGADVTGTVEPETLAKRVIAKFGGAR
jgi:hypothetical protein